MQIQAHVAAVGVDEHIVGPAGDLQVAFRLQLRGGLVVDDLVGAQNVVAIVDHHIAGQGPCHRPRGHAGAGLPLHRYAACRRRLRLGHGQNLLAGIVRQGGGKPGAGSALAGAIRGGCARSISVFDGRGCRIGQRLPPKLQVTEGQHRDKH